MKPTEMITNSPVAAVVTDPRLPDNPIVDCNEAFVSLTGYPRDEILGRNCRFLSGPETETGSRDVIRSALLNEQPVLVEILNYRKNGTSFRNAVMIAPFYDGEGRLEYFLGSQVEVTEKQRAGEENGHSAMERIARLSDRQREVLAQMAAGKRNKRIAFELDLTERTVKLHRATLIRALGVRTAAEAIRLAIEAGY